MDIVLLQISAIAMKAITTPKRKNNVFHSASPNAIMASVSLPISANVMLAIHSVTENVNQCVPKVVAMEFVEHRNYASVIRDITR